jgi:hypothetical protein
MIMERMSLLVILLFPQPPSSRVNAWCPHELYCWCLAYKALQPFLPPIYTLSVVHFSVLSDPLSLPLPMAPSHSYIFSPPVDIESMPIVGQPNNTSFSGTAPSYSVFLSHPTTDHNFEALDDGYCNHTALNCIKVLLQHGFNNPSNADSTLPCSSWLQLMADLMLTCHNSLHSSHSHEITPLDFSRLDSKEIDSLHVITATAYALHNYFDDDGNFKDPLGDKSEWDYCRCCLEACQCPNDATIWSATLSCGQDLHALHATLINSHHHLLTEKTEAWYSHEFKSLTIV